MFRKRSSFWPLLPLLGLCTLPLGCSIKGMAMKSIANSLSGEGAGVYLTDDDPVLVATASGFVMYAHAWVLLPATELQGDDLPRARAERRRAKKLFLRGREYAGRALELRAPGILDGLREDPTAAMEGLDEDGIPAMYWYAAALGSAISSDVNDMELMVDLPVVSALLNRALVLDEGWNAGAIHELLLVVVASSSMGGGDTAAAEAHFRKAMELNGGRSIGPLVSMAETVSVQQQDRERFTSLLQEALAFDVDLYPETRLANLISQKHARWLMEEIDEFFFQDGGQPLEGMPMHGGMFRWPRR